MGARARDRRCDLIESERFDALRPPVVVVLADDRAVSEPGDDAHGHGNIRTAGRAPRGDSDAHDESVTEVDQRLGRVLDVPAAPLRAPESDELAPALVAVVAITKPLGGGPPAPPPMMLNSMSGSKTSP